MRKVLFCVLVLFTTPSPILAKGCLRGAAVGAVAGHFVGKGHAVAGAAAGCAIGHHEATKHANDQKSAGQHK